MNRGSFLLAASIFAELLLNIPLVAGAATRAEADTLSYTYLRGGYVNTSLDNSSVDGDGVGLEGALGLNDSVFLLGNTTFQEFDFGIDVTRIEIGVGGHVPLANRLDAVGSVSYLHAEVDAGPADSDNNALGLGLGLRGRLTDSLELKGGVKYADVDRFRDDLSLNVGARYFLTQQFALGAGIETGDDVTIWNVSVCYDFR